jgi:hypothetical protein
MAFVNRGNKQEILRGLPPPPVQVSGQQRDHSAQVNNQEIPNEDPLYLLASAAPVPPHDVVSTISAYSSTPLGGSTNPYAEPYTDALMDELDEFRHDDIFDSGWNDVPLDANGTLNGFEGTFNPLECSRVAERFTLEFGMLPTDYASKLHDYAHRYFTYFDPVIPLFHRGTLKLSWEKARQRRLDKTPFEVRSTDVARTTVLFVIFSMWSGRRTVIDWGKAHHLRLLDFLTTQKLLGRTFNRVHSVAPSSVRDWESWIAKEETLR